MASVFETPGQGKKIENKNTLPEANLQGACMELYASCTGQPLSVAASEWSADIPGSPSDKFHNYLIAHPEVMNYDLSDKTKLKELLDDSGIPTERLN